MSLSAFDVVSVWDFSISRWGVVVLVILEESGVLGVPSRRGLTPRGSLECNPEIPAFPGEEN